MKLSIFSLSMATILSVSSVIAGDLDVDGKITQEVKVNNYNADQSNGFRAVQSANLVYASDDITIDGEVNQTFNAKKATMNQKNTVCSTQALNTVQSGSSCGM